MNTLNTSIASLLLPKPSLWKCKHSTTTYGQNDQNLRGTPFLHYFVIKGWGLWHVRVELCYRKCQKMAAECLASSKLRFDFLKIICKFFIANGMEHRNKRSICVSTFKTNIWDTKWSSRSGISPKNSTIRRRKKGGNERWSGFGAKIKISVLLFFFSASCVSWFTSCV